MIRRLPIISTVIVGLAVATMIGLGVWQLRRAEQKDALLARYQAAVGLPPTAWPMRPMGAEEQLPLFRKATAMCLQTVASKVTAGRNRQGESGYSHLVDCRTGMEGPGMRVDIGWSKDPQAGSGWKGGSVSGTIAPDSEMRLRLVSDQGFAGLQPSAPPRLEDIPDNHIGYAITWFSFAGIALLIYGLALRGRKPKAEP